MASLEPGKLIHTRTYDVEAVVVDDFHFQLRGRVHDVKPDGLWGIVDIEPMSLHEMTVAMTVRVADLVITEVATTMTEHPQSECPLILPAYQQLVGLSIARGFTQKVKELFGGPRACTHIGALINAMAPVAMQSMWAFSHLVAANEPNSSSAVASTPEEQEAMLEARRKQRMELSVARNRNTCHVWADNGPMPVRIGAGAGFRAPLWAEKRLAKRGISMEEWARNSGM
jgi:Protein of unknown function (DUF2889)